MRPPRHGRLNDRPTGPLHRTPFTSFASIVVLAAVSAACAMPAGATANAGSADPEAQAVAPLPTTLASAWSKTMAANPGLLAAKYGVSAADGAILQSKARPNPELAFSQEDTRSTNRSSTVLINQLIELGGKREARMRIAEGEKATASATAHEVQTALRFQLVTYFNELLLAQQRLQYALKTHELANSAMDAAHKRVKAGKVPPLEASKAEVAEANAALEMQQARSFLEVARQNLASLWGGRASDVGDARGEFNLTDAPPTLEQLEAQLDNAPAMVLARRMLEQSRAVSDLERARRVQDPTISLGVKRASEVGRNQMVLGVSIPLPLFDHNAGNQLQALRKVDQAEQKLQEQRLQLHAQVFAARQQLLSSNQQVAVLKDKVIPTAQSAYDVAVRGFTLGKFSFLDALDAQRTLFESQRQLLEQLMTSHRSRAEIDRLLGTAPMDLASCGI